MRHVVASPLPLLLLTPLLACGDPSTGPGTTGPVPVAALRLEPGGLRLTPGTTGVMAAIVTDAEGSVLTGRTITWSTSNATVASVAAGVVTALAPGTATVQATSEGRSASAAVTVDPPTVVSILLEPASLRLEVGDEAEVTATPTGAGGIPLRDRVVTWTSSVPGVASVDDGRIRALTVGSSTVTATSDGRSASLAVEVVAPAPVQAVFTTLAAGASHTCGLDSAGRAWCWGQGRWGQTGAGSAVGSRLARPVAGELTFTSISAEQNLTCALTPGGEAYCWGWNVRGSVGDGTTTQRNVPTPVQGGLTFVDVAAGGDHACGRTADGRAFCWGRNSFGQLGDGTTVDRTSPIQVAGEHRFSTLDVGYQHSCGIDDAGRALCWGLGQYGATGVGNSQNRTLPTPVVGDLRFTTVHAGGYGTCAVAVGGAAYCWGDAGMASQSATPLPVSTTLRFSDVHAAWGFGCGVGEDGHGYCWGTNTSGVLGDGGSTARPGQPGAVTGVERFSVMAPGWFHACGLDEEGAAWCWGDNGDGQVGDGTSFPRWAPTPVLVTPGP